MIETNVAVRSIVANHTRRAPWLGAGDLQQQAALVMMECSSTWRPALGPIKPYQAAAVDRRLYRYVAEQRSPVQAYTGTKHTPTGATRVDVAAIEGHGYHAPDADDMDMMRAAREVRAIMAAQTEAARLVLLEEEKPAQVASILGIPIDRVYQQTRAAKRALRGSGRLQQLAEGLFA